ncbi:F-box protein at3g03040 [Phtheirospermum japonicum]|uniref:F-box protein at3g03040 n=1 Tax=Phtheirospermum japonicum TaxID=374723 RepID=A0A830CWN6_9LAMI|nr:F-box protein at3g03040 [Phtheirospermum japonicum]
MAESRIVVAINCEFELPEHIIQLILSFLTGIEAAQTAVVSKSWRKAWLTRPNIDFDNTDSPYNDEEVLELAKKKKTIQRYEESNMKIESLRLSLRSLRYADFDLANILIVKALKLCSHLMIRL